jgi:hypothetical protein
MNVVPLMLRVVRIVYPRQDQLDLFVSDQIFEHPQQGLFRRLRRQIDPNTGVQVRRAEGRGSGRLYLLVRSQLLPCPDSTTGRKWSLWTTAFAVQRTRFAGQRRIATI